jgi:hypothetical protein
MVLFCWQSTASNDGSRLSLNFLREGAKKKRNRFAVFFCLFAASRLRVNPERTSEQFRFSPSSSFQRLSTAEGLVKLESSLCAGWTKSWIPASAGMTNKSEHPKMRQFEAAAFQ